MTTIENGPEKMISTIDLPGLQVEVVFHGTEAQTITATTLGEGSVTLPVETLLRMHTVLQGARQQVQDGRAVCQLHGMYQKGDWHCRRCEEERRRLTEPKTAMLIGSGNGEEAF